METKVNGLLPVDIKLGIMYHIITSKNAAADLVRIAQEDSPETAMELAALIETINADQRLLNRLTQDHFENYDAPEFNVDTWYEALKLHKISLWRIKPTSDRMLSKYRIIYAFDGRRGQDIYYVLGFVERSFEYDSGSEIAQRIFSDYEALELPYIR